ncbi:cation-translocating P-type ATPase [Lutibacter flavus]|uniref:Ca2+-transporting ATPase n=1 Tax=Lutibacter flavus TaxID=691689 RepID=A0A238X4F7_9FLAO|nr:cation-translocating P-type ATPase [Lutibacter flavus]SNR53905.1 Ca2+-transporting ATPase [Lutibacter flavus]
MIRGLTTAEAKKKLKIFGRNELPTVKPKSVWYIALEVVKEPMFLLLITSSMLYIILGDHTEGVILLITILIIISITFYQYQKTEKALDALKKLASPRALVIRDGTETRIPGNQVVPDDILILHEGDRIAADAELQETVNLVVDESMLTGESIPVTKSVVGDEKNASNLVFSGTLVVQGTALVKVIATGTSTQFGKIGTSLQEIVKDKTRLQLEMKVLVKRLFIIGVLLCIGVVLAFYFTRGNLVQSTLNGLSTAIAILPEEFPMVLTVFLAMGAWRLSKKNVLTRNPSVIETLGSATVLCTDKTGTITQNKMEVTALYNGEKTFVKKDFYKNQKQLFGLISTAQLASQKDSIDPMETAIDNVFGLNVTQKENGYKLLKEYPLSKELFTMTHVLEKIEDQSISASIKGSPEAVLGFCKLTKTATEKHLLVLNKMAEKGFRVIAVATASVKDKVLPKKQGDFNFNFLGFIGFEDPIRPEVPQAIKECNHAGIKVIMITGDYPATAKSIAGQIGLASDVLITGDELKNMNADELQEKITKATIFARVVPKQKLQIVNALKANNEIVAMTGDGVNDAPALKAAHIGIAMGSKGTDVAREASSLVLLDDNFASIVAAIRSGRRIFDNLQKAMSYIVAIHVPIIGLTLLPAFFAELPILLLPLHIVFMELIIDPVCAIAFEYEQEEKGIMNRKPRDPNTKFFGQQKMITSALAGFLLFFMVVSVYFNAIYQGHSNQEVRAITFAALIIGNIFLILTNLSKTRSFIAVFKEKNYAVIIILSVAIIMLFLIIGVPYLQSLFNFHNPGFKHFISSVALAIVMLVILETLKYLKTRKQV